MRSNNSQIFRQVLILLAGGVAAPTAWADCVPPMADDCEPGYVLGDHALHDTPQTWLQFALEPGASDHDYPRAADAWDFSLDDGLAFSLPAAPPRELPVKRHAAIDVVADGEPAFAVLFGSAARLLSDGTVALGRGELRSNSPGNYSSQWGDLLPAAFGAWNDRLDVDVGLNYARTKRFSTSVGLAEKIGNQNDDAAVVGWFEYRF